MKRQPDKDSYKDPVCGMLVSHTTAADEIEYGGRKYYFCAGICREAFEMEPEKYMPERRQHRLRH